MPPAAIVVVAFGEAIQVAEQNDQRELPGLLRPRRLDGRVRQSAFVGLPLDDRVVLLAALGRAVLAEPVIRRFLVTESVKVTIAWVYPSRQRSDGVFGRSP